MALNSGNVSSPQCGPSRASSSSYSSNFRRFQHKFHSGLLPKEPTTEVTGELHEFQNDISQMQTVFRGFDGGPQLNVRFKESQLVKRDSQSTRRELTYSEPIQFTKSKTTTCFTERREKQSGPPPKKRKVIKYPRKDEHTVLSSRKPISAYIPMDAWALIFQRSDPKFLLQAQLVCRDFRDILSTHSIWRQARQYTYGSTVPDCPGDLTEKQYANLLVGKGCQIKPCTQRLTRKVYWAFMLRMCEPCLNKRTLRHEDDSEEATSYRQIYLQLPYGVRRTIPAQLSGLLPATSTVGIGGAYSQTRPLDRHNDMWRYPDESRHYCVIAEDYTNLKQEFRDQVGPNPLMTDQKMFTSWALSTWQTTRDRVKAARELDIMRRDLLERFPTLRRDKSDFFRDQAELLNRPMSYAVLTRMAAYHKALDTPNAASQRAWDVLADKIDVAELRTQAEQLIAWEREEYDWSLSNHEDLYDRLAQHRGQTEAFIKYKWGIQNSAESEEQRFVTQIAEEELEGLIDVAHDEDVLLMLLQNVRRAYESTDLKPEGMNSDGVYGEYTLMLDDARMIVDRVLAREATQRGILRKRRILQSLRCVACTRKDCQKTYGFEDLIIHVRQTHCGFVGAGLHFWKLAVPTPPKFKRYSNPVSWYQIPWPKSFPALPYHQKASCGTGWDPDADSDHLQRKSEADVRIFAHVNVIRNSGSSITYTDDFTAAVKTLMVTRLDSAGIVRVAFDYAGRRQVSPEDEHGIVLETSISQLQELEALTKTLTSRVEFKFKCGLCMVDPSTMNGSRGKQKRETMYAQPLNALATHWRKKHAIENDSVEVNLISLPTDLMLQETVSSEDAKLEAQKERIYKATTGAKSGDGLDDGVQQKRSPRDEALLQIPSIQTQLRLLFTPREGQV